MKVTIEIPKEIVRKAQMMYILNMDEEKLPKEILAIEKASERLRNSDEPIFVDLKKFGDNYKEIALGFALLALVNDL